MEKVRAMKLDEVSTGRYSAEMLLDFFMQTFWPVIIFEPDGKALMANTIATETYDVMEGDRTEAVWEKLGFNCEQVDSLKRQLSEVRASGQMARQEMTLSTGSQVEYTFFPLRDEVREVVAFTVADVTEQRLSRSLSEALNLIHQDLGAITNPEARFETVLESIRLALSADHAILMTRMDHEWRVVSTSRMSFAPRVRSFSSDLFRRAFPRIGTGEVACLEASAALGDLNGLLPEELNGGLIMTVPLTNSQGIVGTVLIIYRDKPNIHPIQLDFAQKIGVAMSLNMEADRMRSDTEDRAALLHEIIERYPSAIALLSYPAMELEVANSTFLRFSKGGAMADVLSPTARETLDRLCRMATTSRAVQSGEEIPINMDGRQAYWSFNIVPLDEGRKVLLYTYDVTTQVQERQRFQEMASKEEGERRRLSAILETMPVGVMVVDEHGRIENANRLRNEIWGGDPPTTDIDIHTKVDGFWSETGMPVSTEEWPIHRALKEGVTTIGAMVDIRRSDNTMGTVLISTAPVTDSNGRVIGAVTAMQDITPQRRLEHEAIDAKQKMELYLDVLAHDVNNLNTAAAGYLQLYLAREEVTANGKRYLDNTGEMLMEIDALIENIRKLQALETMEGSRNLTDLSAVLMESISFVERIPGRDVRVEYRGVRKAMVMANELLKDLFDNLLNNAVKHSPDPVRIKVTVGKRLLEAREYYQVDVEDNGPGIPDEIKVKVFNRFQRGSSNAHGRGLGLHLVKKIVQEFGGTVWVEDSVSGDRTKGARFVVYLPATKAVPVT
jgi:signal transduction histidine kinase